MDTRNFLNSIDRVINDLYETPLDYIKDFRKKMLSLKVEDEIGYQTNQIFLRCLRYRTFNGNIESRAISSFTIRYQNPSGYPYIYYIHYDLR